MKPGRVLQRGHFMIAIIDYGAGNIRSIARALAYLGENARVTDDPRVVAEARAALGQVGWAAAVAAGRALSLEQAIAEALGEARAG